MEGVVQKSFDESSEKGLVIYVGQKEMYGLYSYGFYNTEPRGLHLRWKSSTNKYRQSHRIDSIPTIVRFNDVCKPLETLLRMFNSVCTG